MGKSMIHTGNLLKSMREYRRLTQDQVAVLLGKSKGNISQLEKQPFATTRIIDEWAKALDFSIEIKAEPNGIEKPLPDNFL
jgi:transcriptional regulator with XRE-family HTH domain